MKKEKFSSIRCSNRGPARTKSRFSLQSVRCTSRESGGMPDYRRYRLSAVETFRFAAVLAVISLTSGAGTPAEKAEASAGKTVS